MALPCWLSHWVSQASAQAQRLRKRLMQIGPAVVDVSLMKLAAA